MAIYAAVALCVVVPAFAREQGQLYVTREDGYGRLILSFPGLDRLPSYKMRIENGVLSIEFGEQVSVILPDVGTTMSDYLSVARVDPDGRGLRMGLRKSFNFNRIEAGEKLFIDLLPTNWQGMPPPCRRKWWTSWPNGRGWPPSARSVSARPPMPKR
ncbi:hypothetical protein N8D56_14110 [Devosia sp. A8/3-2]|nr:hypothetical protein N8D56_14110 [Devosia sp. A8/3-2]